jgi:hypothetical protein
MLNRHEIDLQNLDRKTLTPELWGQIKAQAVRRAHEERSQVMSEFFGMLAFWRRPAVRRRDFSPRIFKASRA